MAISPLKKTGGFLESFIRGFKLRLHIDATACGVEISDQAVRLCRFTDVGWKMYSIRLTPGVVKGGHVLDPEALTAALVSLKETAFGGKEKKAKYNVIVSLSSAAIYNQLFNLPVIEGGNLDKAVELNLQMASPLGEAQSYSGWQIAHKDDDRMRYEIASVFVERVVVDAFGAAFLAAGFVVLSVESKAISLARVLAERSDTIDPTGAYLVLWIDDAGMDLIIVRGGKFYFEYMGPWRDLADEKGEISDDAFTAALSQNLRQLINFYGQHWPDPAQAVIVGPGPMADRLRDVIGAITAQPVLLFSVAADGSALPADSLVAWGAALRGLDPAAGKQEINLLGSDAELAFEKERYLGFMRFWMTILPVILGLLVCILIVGDLFVASIAKNLVSSTNIISASTTEELQTLIAQADVFNDAVMMVRSAEGSSAAFSGSALIAGVETIASANGITISDLNFVSPADPVSFAGTASNQSDIVSFEKALAASPGVTDVNLPLASIQPTTGGFSFSLMFSYAPSS